MSELPAPLSAPDCYLGGYEFMPLLGTRLFASQFYGLALKNPRAGLAAMKLWWLAYSEQKPAGSLPGSDDDLCRMADLGTDLKAWRAVKPIALHGFVQCSDGRYYHPVICEEAAVAYAARVAERVRKAKWRSKHQKQGPEKTDDTDSGPEGRPAGPDGDGTGTSQSRHADGDGDVTRMSPLTGQDRTGQDSKKEEKEGRKEVGIEGPVPEVAPPKPPVAAPSARPPAKGCRLPDDWNPGEAGREFALSLGIRDPDQTFAKFRDHWHSKDKDATKRDWFAAWRMWCRKELEWQPSQARALAPQMPQLEKPQIRNPFLSMLVTDGLGAQEQSEDHPIFPELSDARH